MQYVDRGLDTAVERILALGRLGSLANEGAVAAKQRARAEMFVEELRAIGFSAGVRDTPGAPIVVGHDRGSRGPSVLFCGHYDAWPPGLLHDKRSNEAAPSASSGAANPCNADQSTQLMAFVEACRAWKAVAGQLPTPVSVLVVGERRSGSVRLTSILRMCADELNADIGLAPAVRISCGAVPTINSMLRGLCCEELTIVAGDRGQRARPRSGAAADPAGILARIIGDLQDPSGHVAIPGFYDDVDPSIWPPRNARAEAPWDSVDLQSVLDLVPPECEREAGLVEATPVWPTIEIESISGSRYNEGLRPALVRRAFARLSLHLVCNQDPEVVRLAFRDFARARAPSDCRIEFTAGPSIRPVRFAVSHPAFSRAQQALTAEWGRQAVFVCGDATPAIYALREALGMEIIVTSFPKDNRACLDPCETPELGIYRLGIRSWARILDALSQ
jgi:acetylornithine deacetylase/succinyl-diaminopimelate desuccinylase-like protein